MGKYLVIADKQTATRYLAFEYGAPRANYMLRNMAGLEKTGYGYKLGAFKTLMEADIKLARIRIAAAWIAGRLGKPLVESAWIRRI